MNRGASERRVDGVTAVTYRHLGITAEGSLAGGIWPWAAKVLRAFATSVDDLSHPERLSSVSAPQTGTTRQNPSSSGGCLPGRRYTAGLPSLWRIPSASPMTKDLTPSQP